MSNRKTLNITIRKHTHTQNTIGHYKQHVVETNLTSIYAETVTNNAELRKYRHMIGQMNYANHTTLKLYVPYKFTFSKQMLKFPSLRHG